MTNNSEIENFYLRNDVKLFTTEHINPNYSHDIMPLKHPFRALLIASSGGGKTNLLLDIINKVGAWQKIKLFVLNADEPIYDYLKSILVDNLEIYESIQSINKHLEDEDNHSEKCQTLYCFDDLIGYSLTQHQHIIKMMIRCRKLAGGCGISALYLSQSYYRIPITIRQQASFIFVRKITSTRDTSAILRDCSGSDMTKQQLLNMYNFCTSGDSITNFLFIDMGSHADERFRKNFSMILDTDKFTDAGRLKQYGAYHCDLAY